MAKEGIDLATEPTMDYNQSASTSDRDQEKDGIPPTYTTSTAIEVDAATSKRIGRRIDLFMMPLMCITYITQSLDKSSVSYAAVFTLRQDLGLHGEQYSWLGSAFFFGYLFLEYPMGYLAQHYHTGRVVGLAVICWGLVLMSTALCHNFTGILIQRIVLGCLESVVTPAFVLLTSVFYLAQEQPLRVCTWWAMNGFAAAIAGLIAYAMGHIHYKTIPSWKWIFILNGSLTAIWGCVLFWCLPASPQTAKFLTPEDRELAVHRLKSNKTGTRNAKVKLYQIKEALNPLKDPQGILLFLASFFNEFPNGGYGSFSGLIIQSLGFTSLQTQLLSIATGFSQVLWMVGAGWFAFKYKNARIWSGMGALVIAFVGFVLQIALPADNTTLRVKAAKMFGVTLMPAYAATCAIIIQMPGQNAAGYTKRTTLVSLAFLGYSLGNITGPHAFTDGQTPQYLYGFIASMVCFVCQWITLGLLRWIYNRENNRREKVYGPSIPEENDALTDLTDRENIHFRYST